MSLIGLLNEVHDYKVLFCIFVIKLSCSSAGITSRKKLAKKAKKRGEREEDKEEGGTLNES